MLAFWSFVWYNRAMKNNKDLLTSNTETVTISRAEYEDLKAQNQWLLEQLRLVRRRKFGASSEKASEEVYEQLSLLFDEAEVYASKAAERENEAEPKPAAVEVRSHTRKRSGSARDILPEDIPVEVVEHELSEEERTCPQCGEQMAVIGREIRETLVLEPARAYLRQDVYFTYGCRRCEKEDISTPILNTPKEPSVIPGGYASPEAVAHIAVQKFVMGSPLYRQEQEWNRQGIRLSRQTMSNWLIRCARDWLTPVYEQLHKELLRHDLLHADETELQVLHEDGKTPQSKSFIWLYRTSGDAAHPVVLYEYQPGRGQEYPKRFLEGFRGYLQTDGYAAYRGLEGVTHVGCWAHARRKFEEARKAMPKGKRSTTAEQGVAYCTQLFKLEEQWKDLSPEERKGKRLEQAKPVLDAMLAWANTRNAAPKAALGKALTYLKNQWTYLNNYLLDGRIELSNNRAERSIKPFVISRKNFLFANTPMGAQSSAVIFSLIETAKENKLDPYRYLVWVLRTAPTLDRTKVDWAKGLLPEYAPEACSLN